MTADRFTDFLVNEVDLDHQVVHIKSLDLLESKKDKTASSVVTEESTDASTQKFTDTQVGDTNEQAGSSKIHQSDNTNVPNVGGEEHESEVVVDDEVTWDDAFESSLSPFLPKPLIVELKKMYLEGPEPPRVSDNGYVSRMHKNSEGVEIPERGQVNELQSSDTMRGRNRNARGGKVRQRGRGGGRSQGSEREDHRKVLSEVCHPARQFCRF